MTSAKIARLGVVWVVLTGILAIGSASAESKARIVRLSEVEGSVQMDRGTGDGLDKTFLNMPVVEGSRLKTGSDGRAEVEFEDGSALRLIPNSEVVFSRLALGDDGQKVSAVQVNAGTVYVNYREKKSGELKLTFGPESVTVTEPVHFRVAMANDEATLAVLKGDLNVTRQSGALEINQKHTAIFNLKTDQYDIAKNIEHVSYDEWDKQQTEYHDRYGASGKSYSSSPYAYGMSDLSYYGNFMSVPGYGTVWQPYFMDASWSPFQDGGWMFYPGAGYMWVSAYPWGWTPYRYGNWAFVPGYGWVWQPGYWNSWYAVPRVVNPPRRVAVLTPPARGRQTVMIGKGLTVNPPSGVPQRRLVIAPGSAGLGVPRGTIRNLDRVSREATKNSRPVEIATEPRGRIAPPSRPAGNGLGSSAGARPPSSPYPPSHVSGPRPPAAAPRMPSAPAPVRSSRPH